KGIKKVILIAKEGPCANTRSTKLVVKKLTSRERLKRSLSTHMGRLCRTLESKEFRYLFIQEAFGNQLHRWIYQNSDFWPLLVELCIIKCHSLRACLAGWITFEFAFRLKNYGGNFK